MTVKGVVEAAASLMMTDWNEGLLIHLSYSPLRWTCRSCSVAANVTSSSLRPCDFKMGKVLGSLQTFRCTYNFDVRLPVAHEDGLDVKGFADVLRGEITILNKELTGAHALINGKLVIEDELCILEDFNDVEFLLPLLQDKYVEACSQKEVLGVVSISGSVCSLTYLNSKEPTSQALMDIKGDIIRSLQSRLEIISDDADRELEPVADGGQETNSKTLSDKPVSRFDRQSQRKQCNLSFPRRVFIPWLEGTYICDYIQSSETMEVVKDHCVELMSIEVPTDASEILEPETEAHNVIASTTKSFWDTATGISSNNSVRGSTNEKPTKAADFNPTIPILVLVLSVIVGLVCYILKI